MSARARVRAIATFAAACHALVASFPLPARAAKPIVIDAAAVRYVASETGGSTRPRFITRRLLAFEARLEMLGQEGGASARDPVDERHVRARDDQTEHAQRHRPTRAPDDGCIALGLVCRVPGRCWLAPLHPVVTKAMHVPRHDAE